MFDSLTSVDQYLTLVGGAYLTFGVLGFVGNAGTVLMICTNRVYRLSAYTLMANVALADSIIMLIAGMGCGIDVLWPDSLYDISVDEERMRRSVSILSDENLIKLLQAMNASAAEGYRKPPMIHYVLSFSEISAWTAGVISYALLGLNRCIAICYYGTRAKCLNQVYVAILGSIVTWIVGFAAATIGSLPEPLIGIRRDMWTVSISQVSGERTTIFIVFIIIINVSAVGAQWICSTLVLLKIRQVKKKISKNKLNQNSANRFRKQARLTFQFFYPSLLCTISTLVYLVKPFLYQKLPTWMMILLHLVSLFNHTCNPFIYAYFNDRMRLTYKDMLTCSALRFQIRKRRHSNPFRNQRHNVSRRSNTNNKYNRRSARSVRSRDGNFVRNSLQMQSRDFEQLCEFMMRVNPLYDSSEGWRESSDDEDFPPESIKELDAIRETTATSHEDRESKSIVLDMGRQTVEHWVKFAKKASI